MKNNFRIEESLKYRELSLPAPPCPENGVICYFSPCWVKYPEKNDVRKEGFVFMHSFRLWSTMTVEAQLQACGSARHTISSQEVQSEKLQHRHLHPHIHSRIPYYRATHMQGESSHCGRPNLETTSQSGSEICFHGGSKFHPVDRFHHHGWLCRW